MDVDPTERRDILAQEAPVWNQKAAAMEAHSPLIQILIDGYEGKRAA